MRLQDLNWMDVERYLETDDRIILITGATEQHAYLSLLTDILIPEKLALAAAEQSHILIAPPLNFGVSDFFLDFPGTISISQPTFDAVMLDVIMSLLHQGFEGFFVLNGHGGNKVPARFNELQDEGSARIAWYDWWRSPAVKQFNSEYGLKSSHANWSENFPFNRVAESPAGPKPDVNLDYRDAMDPRELLGDGNYGGPYQVDDALMDEVFVRVVAEMVGMIDGLKTQD